MAERRALHIQNESTDPAGLFVEALERAGFAVETLHPYDGDPLPETLDGLDAVVAGGGLVDTHQAGEHPVAGPRDPAGARGAGARHALHGAVPGRTGADRGRRRQRLSLHAPRDRLAPGRADRGRRRRRACSTDCRRGSRPCSGTTTPAGRRRHRRADDQPRLAAGDAGRRQRLGHAVPHRGDAAGAAELAGHGRRRPGRQRLSARPLPGSRWTSTWTTHERGRPHAGRTVRGAVRGRLRDQQLELGRVLGPLLEALAPGCQRPGSRPRRRRSATACSPTATSRARPASTVSPARYGWPTAARPASELGPQLAARLRPRRGGWRSRRRRSRRTGASARARGRVRRGRPASSPAAAATRRGTR